MLITSVRDDQNNRWKGHAKRKKNKNTNKMKREKSKGVTQFTGKG